MNKVTAFLLFQFLIINYSVLQAQWVKTNGPSGVTSFAVNSTNLFAGGGAIGVYHSTDQGTSWTCRNPGLKDTSINCLAASENVLLAGTPNGVYRSSDNGMSWTVSDTVKVRYLSDIAIRNSSIFAATFTGVFLSTNNGDSWTAINNGLTDTGESDIADDGTDLFAATQHGVFRTTNDGTNWTPAGLDNTGVGLLEVCNNILFAATYGSNGTVWISSDKGTSWSVSDSGLTDNNILDFEVYGANIFASTAFGGVFLSTNNGVSWAAVNTGLPYSYVNATRVYGSNLYAGSSIGSGLFRRPLTEMITDIKDIERMPIGFFLSQNYPNPFNPSTKISWQLETGSHVSLKVYDITGREAATLVNDYRQAGKYETEFNADALPSGIYFYKILAGNFTETKKMMLLK